MSRFTFTLTLSMIAVFAFGQRVTKRAAIAQTNFSERVEPKSVAPENDKSINITTLFDEDFDTYNVNNTNGAPEGWVVSSNIANQDSLNMFRNLENVAGHSSEIGAPWAGGPTVRDEFLISPEMPVSASNSELWVTQKISYYWYVTEQSDDLWISVSNDDFATETVVFDEDDQAMVEAAGLPWPYESFDSYTAKIDISAWAGQNIKVKFNTKSVSGGSADGTAGVSYYLERVRSVERPQYDAVANGNYTSTFAENGKYAIMPWDQIRDFTSMEAWVTNSGYGNLTGLKFTATIDNGGDPLMTVDTNYFLSGAQDLAANAPLDTFRVSGWDQWDFDINTLQEGEYMYKQTISSVEEDELPVDNTWSFPITITNNPMQRVLCREFESDGTIGVYQYTGNQSGDKLGVNFFSVQKDTVLGMSVFIGSNSVAGTSLRAHLYLRANNTDLGQSGLRDIEESDIGNQVYIPFNSPIAIDSLVRYSIAVEFIYETDQVLSIESYTSYHSADMYRMATLNLGDNWFFPSGQMPKVLIHLKPQMVQNVNNAVVNNNINVYPNPSTGLLHINNIVKNSTIKVYNMLGTQVASINNSSEFNTIDLSSNSAGTYLVKVFSNNNVIVKKVNIVK